MSGTSCFRTRLVKELHCGRHPSTTHKLLQVVQLPSRSPPSSPLIIRVYSRQRPEFRICNSQRGKIPKTVWVIYYALAVLHMKPPAAQYQDTSIPVIHSLNDLHTSENWRFTISTRGNTVYDRNRLTAHCYAIVRTVMVALITVEDGWNISHNAKSAGVILA